MTVSPSQHPLEPGWIDRPHLLFDAGNLSLESGEVIENCQISYVTHGVYRDKSTPVAVFLTAIGSNHHRLDFLIGPDRAFPPDTWFIVAIDALGNGLSSSPSNSPSQAGPLFPRFMIRDMVAAQFCLLTEGLGLSRINAVVGASMGGMQALQWGVSHPDFMDRIVALTPMARTSPWSQAVNAAAREALLADPSGRLWTIVMRILATTTPEAAEDLFEGAADLQAWIDAAASDAPGRGGFDRDDWIAQSHAYDSHDVGQTKGWEGDTVAALRQIKAQTVVLAPPLDLYNPVASAEFAARSILNCTLLIIPTNHGHSGASARQSANGAAINQFIRLFLGK